MDVDFVVVGQGLAGTLLSHHLLSEGKKVLVIDEGSASTSSQVAAGIYNPIVFKRLAKGWRADELIPYAEQYYETFQQQLATTFLHKTPVVKLFVSEDEKLFWQKKKNEQQGIPFLGPVNNAEPDPKYIPAPHGFAPVEHSGNVEVKKMLLAYRTFLKEKNILAEESFRFSDLSVHANNIQWKTITAATIVFCEGHAISANPYFSACRFKPAKGELLTVSIPGYNARYTVNKGIFILPLGNHLFKVGATYEWSELDQEITQKAREELIHKLAQVVKSPFEVLHQEAGIRPCTVDRRPVMGRHPDHSHLALFNGLGTKGVLLGPLLAKEFTGFLVNGTPLDPELDLNRFWPTLQK